MGTSAVVIRRLAEDMVDAMAPWPEIDARISDPITTPLLTRIFDRVEVMREAWWDLALAAVAAEALTWPDEPEINPFLAWPDETFATYPTEDDVLLSLDGDPVCRT